MTAQKITPFLWFDNNADEAMNFYVSIFKNSKVPRVARSDKDPKKSQSVMKAMLQMRKIDSKKLQQACDQA
jgi:predicted 3-demethylubiquinone-9 3-methyltransferase (glyoxalase superfamily)